MQLLETILVPTVFGSGEDPGIETAKALAKAFGSRIVLLHVVHGDVYPVIAEHPGIPELERRLRARYLEQSASGGEDVEIIIERGAASTAICETAESCNANLIVMPACTPHANTEGRLETTARLGTTTERVIRRAATPVWAVRAGAPTTPQNLLCPVDGSDASRRALKNAHHLSKVFEAKLTVLNVQEPFSVLHTGVVLTGAAEMSSVYPHKKSFDEFLSSLDFRDEGWIRKSRSGRAHEQILAEIEQGDIDLVVMGTVGKTTVARFLIGSVTQKVTRSMPCSVLTMKAQEMIRLRMDADLRSLTEGLDRANDLLKSGFAFEAIREFDRCLVVSPTLATAWEGKALAYDQIGDSTGAAQARENAKRIRRRLALKTRM